MLQENLRQLSSQRAACKLCSAFIAVAILLGGAFGRLDTPSLLWVSAPILVLALAEAGYAARERAYLEQARSETSGEPAGGQRLQPAEVGLRGYLSRLGAFSVWPFYLVLWGIFVASAINLPRSLSNNQTATVVPALPSIPGAPNVTSGMNHPGAPQRPQSGPSNLPATYPAYPNIPLHTPTMGYPRPATPVNFGPRPFVRPPITPPSPIAVPGSPPPAANPAR